MDISVIIPFYSNVEWLYEAVNSIDEKKNLKLEIIIVDDGSGIEIDREKFLENNHIVTIYTQKNSGPGKARNLGMSKAKGKYVAFLDSDDLFLPDKLSKQYEFMESNGAIWSHTPYIKFYPNGKEELVDNSNYKGDILPFCFIYNPIATPTVMVLREALFNPIKNFSEKMRFGQDNFMWSRLGAYYPVHSYPEPLSKVRMRGTNATLKAQNHLYVKSNLYQYMKDSNEHYNGKKIPKSLKLIFSVINIEYKIVHSIFKDKKTNMSELLSRIFYIIPFSILKIYKKKYLKKCK